MKTDLKGKTVLITGASAGIGEACAEIYAQAGANLIIIARRLDKLKKLADRLVDQYSIDVLPLALDVRDSHMVEYTLQELVVPFKNIDLFKEVDINSASMDKIDKRVKFNLKISL